MFSPRRRFVGYLWDTSRGNSKVKASLHQVPWATPRSWSQTNDNDIWLSMHAPRKVSSFHNRVSTSCLHHVALEKSWQTDNKRTELPLIATRLVRHPRGSREHVSEKQTKHMLNCAMINDEKQTDELAPLVADGEQNKNKHNSRKCSPLTSPRWTSQHMMLDDDGGQILLYHVPRMQV